MAKRRRGSIRIPQGGWRIQRITTHPGEMLREEFMKPLGVSANKLALDLHVPVTRVTEILHQRRSVTADTALRLGQYFGMSADFWMNLQKSYYLSKARRETGRQIRAEVRPRDAA